MRHRQRLCGMAALLLPFILNACGATPTKPLKKGWDTAPDVVLQYALNSLKSGEVLDWNDETSNYFGSISPLRTFKVARGGYCREFEVVHIAPDGKNTIRRGTACRDNQRWQQVS